MGSRHSGAQLSHTLLGFQPNHCDNQKCLHKFKISIPVGSIAPVAITSNLLAKDKQTYFGGSQNFKLLESQLLVYGCGLLLLKNKEAKQTGEKGSPFFLESQDVPLEGNVASCFSSTSSLLIHTIAQFDFSHLALK